MGCTNLRAVSLSFHFLFRRAAKSTGRIEFHFLFDFHFVVEAIASFSLGERGAEALAELSPPAQPVPADTVVRELVAKPTERGATADPALDPRVKRAASRIHLRPTAK